MADEAAGPSNAQLETLPPRSEYRFELEPGERLSVRLVPETGDAEIFGAELLEGENRWYTFGDEAKGCICSWNGCQIELGEHTQDRKHVYIRRHSAMTRS